MFQLIEENSGRIIRPENHMSSEGADAFRKLLLGLLENPDAGIRFDFSKVREMDAVIFGIFVSFAKTLEAQFPKLRPEIIHAGEDIVNLFQMTRLDRRYIISSEGKA